MFNKGDKVTTGFDGIEGFFLGTDSNGNASVLKRDYSFLGKFDIDNPQGQYIETVPLSSISKIESGCFTFKGYHYYGHGSIKELSLSEIEEWLNRRFTKRIYFVLDNHLDMYYFCGLGEHLPVFLDIMKKHYGLQGIVKEDIAYWSKIVDDNFVFYNGAVHNSDHYAEYLPKWFERKI